MVFLPAVTRIYFLLQEIYFLLQEIFFCDRTLSSYHRKKHFSSQEDFIIEDDHRHENDPKNKDDIYTDCSS